MKEKGEVEDEESGETEGEVKRETGGGGMDDGGTRPFLGDDRGSCWASLQPRQLCSALLCSSFFFSLSLSFFLLFLSNSFQISRSPSLPPFLSLFFFSFF